MEHPGSELLGSTGVGCRERNGREVETESIGEENQRRMDDHEVCLQQRVESSTKEERRRGLERVKRKRDEQKGQAHEMHEPEPPIVCRSVLLPRKWFAPQPRHQRHPAQPHEEGPFSGSPRCGEPVLER